MSTGGANHDVVIIGGGQGGLSLSHELTHAGVDHVILERGRVGETWRRRWDSFCLVTPNWTVQLPGGAYAGDDPDGFMPRDEIVGHLTGYAATFGAPIQEGVTVTSVDAADDGGFTITADHQPVRARRVVVASGGYPKPHLPAAAADFPAPVVRIHSDGYTNPEALPPGEVLVVGSGQTGCQLAEELLESGRTVHLACGRAPWMLRRVDGRDTLKWLAETPFFDVTIADLPSPRARFLSNPQASGHHGGRDLHYRTLQADGVDLVGRLAGVEDGRAHFASDLAESVAFGDARYAEVCELIRGSCLRSGRPVPEMPPPPPFEAGTTESLDIAALGAVVFTTGFRPDYGSWVHFEDAFDDLGFPIQVDGVSSVVPGLNFMGVHYQRKRKSANFLGVGEDAVVLAERMVAGPAA